MKNKASVFFIMAITVFILSFDTIESAIPPTPAARYFAVDSNFTAASGSPVYDPSYWVNMTSYAGLVGLKSPDNSVILNITDPHIFDAWLYEKVITINSTDVNGTQTDFPVLVRITDLDLRDRAQNDGDDILFTATTPAAKYSHEIERYNGTTGELVAWVKVPSVSGSVDTTFQMMYGNALASDQQDIANTWSNGFLAVYHFGEDNIYADSTGNHDDAVNQGTTIGLEELMGSSRNFDGIADYINATGNDPDSEWEATEISMSIWRRANIGGFQSDAFVAAGEPFAPDAWELFAFNNDKSFTLWTDGGGGSTIGIFNDDLDYTGNWEYGVQTFDYNNNDCHIAFANNVTAVNGDGIHQVNDSPNCGLTTVLRDWSAAANAEILFGLDTRGIWALVDQLDEVRIHDIAKSEGWHDTEFNNQKSGSNFLAFGSEENADAQQSILSNEITFIVNSAKNETVGGIFAISCPSNATLTGILENGTAICTDMSVFFP